MKAITLLLVPILISCSTPNSPAKGRYPFEQVENLVNEGKYEEALTVAKTKHVASHLGIKRIEATQKCAPLLKKCDVPTLSTQQTRECKQQIGSNCERKYLTRKMDAQVISLMNKAISSEENNLIAPVVKGKCDDGMKWGYLRVEKSDSQYILFTDKIDYKKLHGEFGAKDKCEEARLLEDSKFNTSKSCYWRYLGEKKTIPLYIALAMKGTGKKNLYFSDKETCEKAVKEGFNHFDSDGTNHSYGALGSSTSSRFIKICEQEVITVCEQYRQGELFLEEII